MKVPFIDLTRQYKKLKPLLLDVFDNVCSSGTYILGDEVDKFEKLAADYCGTKYAIGVANGSDALFLVMKALGIGLGDEVITAPNSFIASAWTIVSVGAKPVFADVGSDYNIDPVAVEKKITSRTKAIMPVHLTGKICNIDAIQKIAEKYNIPILEDAAQAFGASFRSKKAGSFGLAGCFSMHPLKNLHAYGDAGLITTNSLSLKETLLKLRNHGLKNRDECEIWGYNSRLDAIQAAFLNVKMNYIEEWNNKCLAVANMYSEALAQYLKIPTHGLDEKPIYHRYIVECNERERLIDYLRIAGIETRINYPIPIHLQPVGIKMGYKKGDFPLSENQAKKILSLPLYPEIEDFEVQYVIEKIQKFYCDKR